MLSSQNTRLGNAARLFLPFQLMACLVGGVGENSEHRLFPGRKSGRETFFAFLQLVSEHGILGGSLFSNLYAFDFICITLCLDQIRISFNGLETQQEPVNPNRLASHGVKDKEKPKADLTP